MKKSQKIILGNLTNCLLIALTNCFLSNDEYNVVKYGENYDIATNLTKSDILASTEAIWDQNWRIYLANVSYFIPK